MLTEPGFSTYAGGSTWLVVGPGGCHKEQTPSSCNFQTLYFMQR